MMIVKDIKMPKRDRPLSQPQQVIAVRFDGEPSQQRLLDLIHELRHVFEGQGYGRLIPEESAMIIDIFVTTIPAASLQRAIALVEAMIEKHDLGMNALVSTHTD